MKRKTGQFNFNWLFALIVGAAILILAVYGATQIGKTQRFEIDTEIAKKISILTDPLQAGFADARASSIEFKQETRINNICYFDEFGKNDISVSTRSRMGDEWQEAGGATSIHNKYIFSSPSQTGEDYYVFSKGFEFPFEISDLIFLNSGEYCFISPPTRIENEILNLNIDYIEIDNCTEDSLRVCFPSGSDCDISVYGTCMTGCGDMYEEGYVLNNGERLNYVGSLMYGAIFSRKSIYDCNVQRLLFRAGKISEVFVQKSELMNARGCNTNLQADLNVFGGMLSGSSSEDLISLNQFAKQLDLKENNGGLCGLW
jgi:hypothetical protein